MDFTTSSTAQEYLRRLGAFMQEHVLPAEGEYRSKVKNVADWHTSPPTIRYPIAKFGSSSMAR